MSNKPTRDDLTHDIVALFSTTRGIVVAGAILIAVVLGAILGPILGWL